MNKYNDYNFSQLLSMDGDYISFKDADLITNSNNSYIIDWCQEEDMRYPQFDILTLWIQKNDFSDELKISMLVLD